MEGASPLKSGFFRCEFAVRSGVSGEPDFYDQKRVVTFRVLLFRPLQTGLTRHRFCAEAQPCQSTFEQCLPEKGDGATRLHSDPSHRLRVTVRDSHPSVSVVKSFSISSPNSYVVISFREERTLFHKSFRSVCAIVRVDYLHERRPVPLRVLSIF